MYRFVNLDERVTTQMFDPEYKEWSLKTMTIEEMLVSCEDYKTYEISDEEKSVVLIALRKQIAMKPINTGVSLECPACKRILTKVGAVKKSYKYCPKCGQHIDWGEFKI